MFVFRFYINLVTAGLREQHLKTHIKLRGILQSSRKISDLSVIIKLQPI